MGHVVEHRTEQIVLGDVGVEADHELGHLTRFVEVSARGLAHHVNAHASMIGGARSIYLVCTRVFCRAPSWAVSLVPGF